MHGNRGSGNRNLGTLADRVKNDDITPMKGDDRWREPRRRMVEEQLRRRGLRDTRVLDAMLSVPREVFVPPDQLERAYEDRALPIGYSQTISQPYIVAYMTHQLSLEPTSKVLEIGTGTGYQTAILALLAGSVFTVERLAALQTEAAANLRNLGLPKVTMQIGDGSVGLPTHAPYDRIMVTAAAPRVPGSLVDQMAIDGVMVIPVGGPSEQTIVRVTRDGGRTIEKQMLLCRFVKLQGEEGWSTTSPGA